MTATLTTPETSPAATRAFETAVCARCGGNGRYGPLCVYNGICFKCNGAGKLYTKRGHVARNHFEKLCSLPVGCLVSNTTIQVEDVLIGVGGVSFRRTWAVVESVVPYETEVGTGIGYKVYAKHPKTGVGYSLDHGEGTLVRVAQSKDEKAAKLAAALDFQDALTQAGTVAKRKVKAKAA